MANFLKFIRFPNLLIVALTQYLLRYCILQPFYNQLNVPPSLSHFHFFLLVLTTMLIAASGYVINDIYDHKIDLINKPQNTFIGRIYSPTQAWWIYAALLETCFWIALFVAWKVGNLRLAFLFPAAAIPLWLYSWRLKKTALIGNLVVAIFCALVALMVLFAERYSFIRIAETHTLYGEYIFYIFWGYAGFAYLVTMFREIIKDLEDLEGDQQNGARTLPIIAGIPRTKNIAALFGIALVVALFMLLRWQWQNFNWHWFGMLYTLALIFIPALIALLLLGFAKTKTDFHRLSGFLKLIMLTGLLYLPIFSLLFLLKTMA